jgi:hypothetical protein
MSVCYSVTLLCAVGSLLRNGVSPQVNDGGEGFLVWKVTANLLSKFLCGRGLTAFHHRQAACFLEPQTWWVHMNMVTNFQIS